MNNFETFAANSAAAQAHEQEIQQTRIGGLGGSDANLLYRIGINGMSAITATDNKRLAIMMGTAELETWSGNAYTNAGHLFEDFALHTIMEEVFDKMDAGKPIEELEREVVMECKLAKNFRTFAHADFTYGTGNVIECKFVQKTLDKVADEYNAQLQWYYMLGAKKVVLYHGTGTAEPFEVDEVDFMCIERDDKVIDALLNGIKTLDKAISKGWTPIVAEKCNLNDATSAVRDAFDKLAKARLKAAAAKAEEEEAKALLVEYMQDFGYNELNGYFDEDGKEHKATLCKPRTTRTFDMKSFNKACERELAKEVADVVSALIEANYKTSVGASVFSYK